MDRRERFRKGLNKLYLPIYDFLCSNLPQYFQPTCGLRTFQEQDILYSQGRTAPGLIVTKARGGQSAHNYGCATDWTIFDDGKPVWDIKDKRWEEYEFACAKAAAKWGGDFGDYPHNELALTIPWKEVLLVYQDKGIDASENFIAKNLV